MSRLRLASVRAAGPGKAVEPSATGSISVGGGSGSGDIDGNGTVGAGDLTALLAAWTG